MALLSLLTYRVATGQWIDTTIVLEGTGLSRDQWMLGIALSPLFFVVNTLLGGPIAEELGWRGYARSRMQGFLPPNQTGLAILLHGGMIFAEGLLGSDLLLDGT